MSYPKADLSICCSLCLKILLFPVDGTGKSLSWGEGANGRLENALERWAAERICSGTGGSGPTMRGARRRRARLPTPNMAARHLRAPEVATFSRSNRGAPEAAGTRSQTWRRQRPSAPCASRASEEGPGRAGVGVLPGPRGCGVTAALRVSSPPSYAVSRKIEPFYTGGRVQVTAELTARGGSRTSPGPGTFPVSVPFIPR